MNYVVRKKFGHDLGISTAFRQWRADGTHCQKFHGYSLSFEFVIEGSRLDHRNWLFSFGDFKHIREWIFSNFDHKTIIAHDDPHLEEFVKLDAIGVLDLNVIDDVGCEKFAEFVFNTWSHYIMSTSGGRAKLVEVTVSEHGANSATYRE